MPHIRYSVKAVIIEALVILSSHFEIGTETLLTTATPPTANLHNAQAGREGAGRTKDNTCKDRAEDGETLPSNKAQFGRSHSPNQTLHSIAQHTNLKI